MATGYWLMAVSYQSDGPGSTAASQQPQANSQFINYDAAPQG